MQEASGCLCAASCHSIQLELPNSIMMTRERAFHREFLRPEKEVATSGGTSRQWTVCQCFWFQLASDMGAAAGEPGRFVPLLLANAKPEEDSVRSRAEGCLTVAVMPSTRQPLHYESFIKRFKPYLCLAAPLAGPLGRGGGDRVRGKRLAEDRSSCSRGLGAIFYQHSAPALNLDT